VKKSGIDPELEKAIKRLLKEVMSSPDASITDKMKVIDRSIKLEQLKQRMTDDGFGSGFHDDDE
jgi:hypothetical protein